MLKFAAIAPHPPIIIPSIGKPQDLQKVVNTISALKKLGQSYREKSGLGMGDIILISPHLPSFFDRFGVFSAEGFEGDFKQFGDFKTYFQIQGDAEMAKKIVSESNLASIPAAFVYEEHLDHGTLVPLYYISGAQKTLTKLIPISFCNQSLQTHYEFGKVLGEVIKKSESSIALIASGDLSHRLAPEAPAGFSAQGRIFDEKLIQLIKEENDIGIYKMDPRLIEQAGECGLRSILILLGALSVQEEKWHPEVLSYEGPFGVGYLVCEYKPEKKTE